MAGGRYFGYWATFCGFFAVAFAVTCFVTDRWYVIEMPGPVTVSLGLRSMCLRTDFSDDSRTGNVDSTVITTALGGDETCHDLLLDIEKIQCDPGTKNITADQAYTRTNATFGLAITGAIFMLCGFLMIAFLSCCSKDGAGGAGALTALGTVLSFLSLICSVTAMLLYYMTMDRWMYCGKEFCAHWNTLSPCDTSFGYSFYFLVFAVVLSCFVTIALLVGCCSNKVAAKDVEEDEAMASRDVGATRSADRDPASVGLGPSWYFDESYGYWWSDEEKLYFDEESGHYYDAESGQWYDPEAQTWYEE